MNSGNPPCERLLVGVAGSVHAIDIHRYLLLFRQALTREIKVVMTRAAIRMVNPRTVALYADDHVFHDLWDRSPSVNKAPHIQLTRWADLFVVVPATADIVGKAANGIADDLLSTCIVSYPRTVVFAPVMNQAMRQSRAVHRNIARLREDGHYIVDPTVSGVAVGSGTWDEVECPTPETLLLHLRHVRMKELRAGYWDEATSEPPMTPRQRLIMEKGQMASTATSLPTIDVDMGNSEFPS